MQLTTEQKQTYLANMDIDLWFPRMQLTNSQPAVVLDSSQPGVNGAHAAPQPELPDKAAESAMIQPQSGTVTPPEPPSVESLAAESAPDPSAAAPDRVAAGATEKAIHFGLGLYVLGPWLIVSSLSADYQRQQDDAFRLVLSILKQFGNRDHEPAYHHVIAWPFFSNPNADQGKDAASLYVNGVIEHLVEEHQVSRLLSFGGVLAKLNDWDSAEGQDFGLQRLNLPSVFKMLDDPSQKAKAWQLIQASALYKS